MEFKNVDLKIPSYIHLTLYLYSSIELAKSFVRVTYLFIVN
jgi:hypothetical protein